MGVSKPDWLLLIYSALLVSPFDDPGNPMDDGHAWQAEESGKDRGEGGKGGLILHTVIDTDTMDLTPGHFVVLTCTWIVLDCPVLAR